MPLLEEQFSQSRIDAIKRYLHREADKGKAKDFEIQVDGFKVVPRTNDLAEFDDYELELSPESYNVSILIFDGAATNRNTRYSLQMGSAKAAPQALNGTDENGIASLLKEKLEERDKEHELNRLQEKVKELEAQLKESEAWGSQLEQHISEIQEGRHKKVVGLSELAGYVLDGIVKKNPHILNALPGGESLSGLFGLGGNPSPVPANPTTEASFSRKTDSAEITDAQQAWLAFGRQVETNFEQAQAQHLFHILQHFLRHPDDIPLVLDLLQQQNNQQR